MKATDKHTTLTAERVRQLFNYNPATGIFTRLITRGRNMKGTVAGCLHDDGYLWIGIDKHIYASHRIAWLVSHNSWPNELIDHINGIKDDNRLVNLREASHAINQQNSRVAHVDNRSGFLGAHWQKQAKKFQARIVVSGKKLHIGYYSNPEDANQAYLTAKRQLHAGCTI